jgi:hypothetical protein
MHKFYNKSKGTAEKAGLASVESWLTGLMNSRGTVGFSS